MKEKIGKKGIKKRLFSVVLALAMVLTLMPIDSIKVHAAENEYRQFFAMLGNNSPATIEGLVEVSGPDADGYRTFKLLKDITADSSDISSYAIADGSSGNPRKIILDLNGKTIKRNLTIESGAGYNGFAFRIADYVDLIIDDSTASGTPGEGDYVSGIITGGAYSGIRASSTYSKLTLRNGIITENCGTTSGGGISFDKGTLIIEGGEVCNNVSSNTTYGGGGIYTNATFNMTGGAIYGNRATESGGKGGGIYIFGDTKYSITGGKIFNNECNVTGSSYGSGGAGIFTNKNQVGSEIGGSIQVYDNKNIAIPTISSNVFAYQNPEKLKIVPFTTEGNMGFSAGYSSSYQIVKTITQADLSHITSEYTNKFIVYCGGENVHLNLQGENLGAINSHTTHTEGTLWAYTHTHSWRYAKDDDVITAYCANIACPGGTNENNKVTLDLSAKSKKYSDTETYDEAKVLDADGTEIRSDNVNKWTSAGLTAPTISIYKATSEGATSGGSLVSDLTGLPLGNYYARVLVGTQYISKAFKIASHLHDWKYTVGIEADANKLTATCVPEGETCPDSATAILTLTASDANYSGNSVPVTVITSNGFPVKKTASNVVYYESDGTTLVSTTNSGAANAGKAPKLVGSYVAKLTITVADGAAADITASVTYNINKADIASVTFTEPTAPISTETPEDTVEIPDGSNYTAVIAWSPADSVFDYSKVYTATITLTAADNYKFKSDATIPAVWTKSTNTDTTLVLTRTYAETDSADEVAAKAVVAKIDAIGTVEYTSESKAKIDEAREAYDTLTDAQKALVANYDTLTNAETTYEGLVDAAEASAVATKIDAIGTVEYTSESKAKIDEAREAYDALTDAQKELVTNYDTLTAAETAYAGLEADATAASAVVAKIEAIGTVTYTTECKAKIDEAREAYDALTDAQKLLVTNYDTLIAAEAAYAVLEAAAADDAAAAGVVATKIDAIGTVEYTSESKAKIDAARVAYNTLTAAQKLLVTNYDTLTEAEAAYEELEEAAEADATAASAVVTKIETIGTVAYTTECKAKIDAARAAYDALTSTQKALVTNYDTLTTAESTYAELEAEAGSESGDGDGNGSENGDGGSETTPEPVKPAPAPDMATVNIAGTTLNTWEEITVSTPNLTTEMLHKVNESSDDDLLHVNIVGKADKSVPVAAVEALGKSTITGLHVFIGSSDAVTFLNNLDYSKYTGISFNHEDVIEKNSRVIDFTSKGKINATVMFHTLIAPNVKAKVYKVVDNKEVEIATLSSNADGGFCFLIDELTKYVIKY